VLVRNVSSAPKKLHQEGLDQRRRKEEVMYMEEKKCNRSIKGCPACNELRSSTKLRVRLCHTSVFSVKTAILTFAYQKDFFIFRVLWIRAYPLLSIYLSVAMMMRPYNRKYILENDESDFESCSVWIAHWHR